MQPFALPTASKAAVTLAIVGLISAGVLLSNNDAFHFGYFVMALLASAYLSDLITGIAHFCFDYVFPYRTPILGPISYEFTQHHEEPVLDPSDLIENLTKGAYASIPLSLGIILLSLYAGGGFWQFVVETMLLGMPCFSIRSTPTHTWESM